MSGDLVQRPSGFASIDLISGDNFERVERVATGLAQSGVFKDVTSTQNAMAKILLGADLGLTPTQALMNLDVVEGNARVRSVLLGAWVRQHPHYDFRVVEHDAQHCAIEFTYKGEVAGISEFSIEDAKLAGLVKPDKPRSAWMAHPRNMLWARAMSNGVRWYCPDLTGGVAVYTEADEFVESSAVEIASGEGDGTAPGWEGLSEEQIAEIEALIEVEHKLGPGSLDLATVQLMLNHRPEAVEAWLADTRDVLAMRKRPEGDDA
jgi:hypothetical protein